MVRCRVSQYQQRNKVPFFRCICSLYGKSHWSCFLLFDKHISEKEDKYWTIGTGTAIFFILLKRLAILQLSKRRFILKNYRQILRMHCTEELQSKGASLLFNPYFQTTNWSLLLQKVTGRGNGSLGVTWKFKSQVLRFILFYGLVGIWIILCLLNCHHRHSRKLIIIVKLG